MGMGLKTKVLIDNLAMLYDKGKVDGALKVEKGDSTWCNQELPAHLPNYIENVTVLYNCELKNKEKPDLLYQSDHRLHINNER